MPSSVIHHCGHCRRQFLLDGVNVATGDKFWQAQLGGRFLLFGKSSNKCSGNLKVLLVIFQPIGLIVQYKGPGIWSEALFAQATPVMFRDLQGCTQR